MKANFEVKAEKIINGKKRKIIRTWCLDIYSGITRDLYEHYVNAGYENVDVRMMA